MRLQLATFFCLLAFCACQDNADISTEPKTGSLWEFSLDNIPDTSGVMRWVMRPGTQLRVEEDTAWLRPIGIEETPYPLATRAELTDSSETRLVLTQASENELVAEQFFNDSLLQTIAFAPLDTSLQIADFNDLVGHTYLFRKPGQDSSRVYFGFANKILGQPTEGYYIIAGRSEQQEARSLVIPGTGSSYFYSSARYRPAPMWSKFIFLRSKAPSSLGAEPFLVVRTPDGTLAATYVNQEAGRYRRQVVPLREFSSGIKSSTSLEELSDRLSMGKVSIDRSYPRVDSANVRYYYEADFIRYGGVAAADLAKITLDFSPEGEFFLLAGKRLLKSGRWELSPDNNYLVVLQKDGMPRDHYPILHYDDEVIELRLPLLVGTREPRGVELTSYVMLDAFVRVERL